MAASRLRSWLGLAAVVLLVGGAMQGMERWSQGRLGAQIAGAAQPGDIHMIASVTCIYCDRARAWFNDNRVPFSECMIERDAGCAAQYRALLAPGTPVLLVRGQRLVGFSAQAVADALVHTH